MQNFRVLLKIPVTLGFKAVIILASKLIGAGVATTGVMGAGVGIGNLFHGYLVALSRSPNMKTELFSTMILGFALTEATALFALLMSFMLLFAF